MPGSDDRRSTPSPAVRGGRKPARANPVAEATPDSARPRRTTAAKGTAAAGPAAKATVVKGTAAKSTAVKGTAVKGTAARGTAATSNGQAQPRGTGASNGRARTVVGPVRRRPVPAAPVPRQGGAPEVAPNRAAPARRSDPPQVRILRVAVVTLLVLGLGGSIIDGANRPANPTLVPAPDPAAAKGSPAMGSATLSVAGAHQRPACLLEAVTAQQQEAGLMNRRTVAPYSGMAFVFAQPTTVRFWMKNTLIPLSIAWFDARGRYLTSTLMPPCPPQTASCPTYGPAQPYTLAVEVPAGGLHRLAIGPGATAQLGGPCG